MPRASELGLAALHGSTPDVSIAGYGLGGGLGWYGRKHGLFTNSITAIELVTADGELRRVDADNEPELFWALRGGGGNFGVVTALEFRLFPISEVYAGALFFPWERSAEVLHAWRNWIRTVPDEVTSVGRILQFPPHRRAFRSRCAAGRSRSSTRTRSAPRPRASSGWRRFGRSGPEIDTVADGAAGRALRDAHGPARSAAVLRRASRAPRRAGRGDRRRRRCRRAGVGLDARVDRDEARGRRLGRGGEGHGALDKLPGEFVYFGLGMASDDLEDAATRRDLHRVTGALRPYRSGSYLNFEEERGRRRELLRRGDVPPAPRREGRRRPGRAVPGEPPDPAGGSSVTTGIHGGGETVSPPPHRGRRRPPGRS